MSESNSSSAVNERNVAGRCGNRVRQPTLGAEISLEITLVGLCPTPLPVNLRR